VKIRIGRGDRVSAGMTVGLRRAVMPVHGYPLAPLVAAMRRPTDLSPTCCRRNRPTPVLNTTAAAHQATLGDGLWELGAPPAAAGAPIEQIVNIRFSTAPTRCPAPSRPAAEKCRWPYPESHAPRALACSPPCYPLAPLVAAMRRPTDLSPTCCRRNRPTPLLNTTAAALSGWKRVRRHLLFGGGPTSRA
jgi:hypothetical protein